MKITVRREKSHDKKPTSDNVVMTLENKKNQSQEVIEFKASQTSGTPNSHHRKSK